MKQIYCTAALSALLLMACTKHNENNDLNSVDYQFLQQVSRYNKAEIAMGELATTKSSNASVASLAQNMVVDYTGTQTELEGQASYLQVALLDSLNIGSRNTTNSLESFSGYQFDTAYLHSRVRAHQMMLAVYQKTFNEGNNASIKGFVHRHIDLVKDNYLRADSLVRRL